MVLTILLSCLLRIWDREKLVQQEGPAELWREYGHLATFIGYREWKSMGKHLEETTYQMGNLALGEIAKEGRGCKKQKKKEFIWDLSLVRSDLQYFEIKWMYLSCCLLLVGLFRFLFVWGFWGEGFWGGGSSLLVPEFVQPSRWWYEGSFQCMLTAHRQLTFEV